MKKLTLFAAILLMASVICAQTINVPADQPSIQAAIEIAAVGDTVLVAEGTYLENINFLGKAITVASRFILDGDTAHISRTIIDGSQPAHPDTASVVTMWSGEDTTSVLMGFTLTGGKGTLSKWDNDPNIIGGAILLLSSGGKICNNIIEDNHTNHHGYGHMIYGGTVFASVDKQHRAIIRKNVIRNNTTQADWFDGGCIFLNGGGILLESNQILNNSVTGSYGYGAGLAIFNYNTTDEIEEVIVRNNIITGNSGTSSGGTKCAGGGIFIAYTYINRGPEIYNNIITGNSVDGEGGGIAQWLDFAAIYNNTIFNNEADRGGNNIAPGEGTMILFNNILGADKELSGQDIAHSTAVKKGPLFAYYNVLKEPLNTDGTITSIGNIVGDAEFESDFFNLSAMSPGIGWGLDSLQIDGISYYAPLTDFNGNPRPHSIDNRMDAGAVESPYYSIVNIPDKAFLNALIDLGVDTNGDSLISYSEAGAIVELGLENKGISDLTGIEAFVNLVTLGCYNNELTSLDFANNTALRSLECAQNQLAILDVSNNTALRTLSCSYNQLTSLDVSNNTLLGTDLFVAGLYCHHNQLTNLNVSNNTALPILWCHNNLLTELDVSKNTELLELDCSNNQLTSLDLANNTKLSKIILPEHGLNVSNNQLTSLDISNCKDLVVFYAANMPSLYQVCVWSGYVSFYDSVKVDTSGSPNVYFTPNCTIGIEKTIHSGLTIYPNPTNGLLTIENIKGNRNSIEITSLNGQQIFTDEMEGAIYEIDLSSFQKGIYFITLRSDEFVTTQKIIKL